MAFFSLNTHNTLNSLSDEQTKFLNKEAFSGNHFNFNFVIYIWY